MRTKTAVNPHHFQSVRVVGNNVWYIDFVIEDTTATVSRVEGDATQRGLEELAQAVRAWATEKGYNITDVKVVA